MNEGNIFTFFCRIHLKILLEEYFTAVFDVRYLFRPQQQQSFSSSLQILHFHTTPLDDHNTPPEREWKVHDRVLRLYFTLRIFSLFLWHLFCSTLSLRDFFFFNSNEFIKILFIGKGWTMNRTAKNSQCDLSSITWVLNKCMLFSPCINFVSFLLPSPGVLKSETVAS